MDDDTASADVTVEPYSAADYDAARELIELGNRVGGVCVSYRAIGETHWTKPQVIYRFPPAPRRAPSMPVTSAPASLPRAREHRASRRTSGASPPSSDRSDPSRLGASHERRLLDEIDAIARRILRLREMQASEHDQLRVLEIRSLEERLNGPDSWWTVALIRDPRTGRLFAQRDRRIGGLWAELRETRRDRVRPVLLVTVEDTCECSRGHHQVKVSDLYPRRAWCRDCETKRQHELYERRLREKAAA